MTCILKVKRGLEEITLVHRYVIHVGFCAKRLMLQFANTKQMFPMSHVIDFHLYDYDG